MLRTAQQSRLQHHHSSPTTSNPPTRSRSGSHVSVAPTGGSPTTTTSSPSAGIESDNVPTVHPSSYNSKTPAPSRKSASPRPITAVPPTGAVSPAPTAVVHSFVRLVAHLPTECVCEWNIYGCCMQVLLQTYSQTNFGNNCAVISWTQQPSHATFANNIAIAQQRSGDIEMRGLLSTDD